MNQLFESLSLGIILRHLVCGFIFTLTAVHCHFGGFGLLASEGNLALFSIIALPSGMLIYGINRGLLNALAEFLRYYCIPKTWLNFFLPRKCLDALKSRWIARQLTVSEPCDKNKIVCQHIEAWADYVHLLYTSGLAIWMGSLTLWFTHSYADLHWNCGIFLSGLFLILVGFINDLRKQAAEEMVYSELKCKDLAKTQKTPGTCDGHV